MVTHGASNQASGIAPGHNDPASAGAIPGFELGEILRILQERKRIVIIAGVVGLVLGLVLALLTPARYSASAMLELNSQANEIIDAAKSDRQTYKSNSAEMVATQIGLLRSKSLAQRVAQDLNLASNPEFGGVGGSREARTMRAANMILGQTTAESVKGSLLIRVSSEAADPQMAARIANAMAEGFIASSLDRRYDSSSYARRFLSDQLARTKAALEESERNLNNYSIDAALFKTPGKSADGRSDEGSTLAAEDLAAMNSALNEARVRRINAEQSYRNSSLDYLAEQSANVNTLMAQRSALEAEYAENSKIYKPDYPRMRQLAAQIQRLDTEIGANRGRISGNKRSELKGEYDAALRTEQQIARKVAEAKGEVQSERSRSIQYNILQRDADTNRTQYDALLQRYKEITVAGGIGQSNVSLVDRADPPAAPFRPRPIVNSIVGLILGLGLGVALAFAVHLLFDNIIDAGDVRRKLRLPLLGVIPMADEELSLMDALADPKSDVSEAYYSVRTALKFARPEGIPHSIVVTSTQPGEGKSTSSYAIASSIARLGSKVLLVDADMRKPTFVSTRADGFGLAHLLGTEDPLAEYAQATKSKNLHLLPVGRFVGSAAELLASSRLPSIITEARQKYDYVVIDAPPVLGLSDTPLLSSVAEATILVVESRKSRTNNVTEILRRLAEAGSSVMGVILTKVSRNNGNYGYSYYSYQYGDDDQGGKVSSDPARALDLG